MRSALAQALDIIGPDADAEQTIILACTIADLMFAQDFQAQDASPAVRAARAAGDGAAWIRAVLAAPLPFRLVDWTEPEAVLRRLGIAPLS